jgi:two-component system, OmpR family, phosphate regulon sensor histidine kinase PhoR
MKLGVRTKLFTASVALILTVGLASGIYLQRELRRSLEHHIESELLSYTVMTRELVETAGGDFSIETIHGLTRRLGRSVEARITVIAPDGQVLGESHLSIEELMHVEPHLQRPEVLSALAAAPGQARRYSTTVQADMLYVALPFQHPQGTGVVRVAMPLRDVDEAIARLRVLLLVAGLIGLAAAVLMSGLASHFMSRTLRMLADSARAIASGDARRRIDLSSSDELGGLAGSVNRMADDIESTVAALATERARFKAVLEGMSEVVITLDRERRITLVNRAAMALLDLDESAIGQMFIEHVRAPAIQSLLVQAAEERSCEFDLPGTPPRRVLARITPQHGDDGYIIVMHDVTGIRQLETVRRDFVANVSHELRTPVSIIRANAETLLDGALTDPVYGQRLLEALYRNAERLSRIIADLLDLSRLEANRYQLDSDRVSVVEAVEQAVDSVDRSAQARQIRIEMDLDPDLRVHADDKALDQILVNYLDNAIKYTPPGGCIRVATRIEGDRVRIDVTDNGPGIEPGKWPSEMGYTARP